MNEKSSLEEGVKLDKYYGAKKCWKTFVSN
jgi:hypothetical protein